MSSSHIIVGLGMASAVPGSIFVTDLKQTIIYFMVIVFASVAPDLDTTKSAISRLLFPFKPLIYLVEKKYGHRTITHSFYFWMFVSVLFLIVTNNLYLSMLFSVAYLSHIFADIITESGVKAFYPFNKKKLSFFRFALNGFAENTIKYVLFLFFIFINIKDITTIVRGLV
jgi:inner membrane protein